MRQIPPTQRDRGSFRPAGRRLAPQSSRLLPRRTLPRCHTAGAERSFRVLCDPPSKDYVFDAIPDFVFAGHGFTPRVSFAAGGLAEAWAGGCYAFNDADLAAFPFDYADIAPHYAEIADRIGVAGVEDNLARFYPCHEHLSEPPSLDENSARLLARYEERRFALTSKHGITMGRSRQTVLTEGRTGRDGCRYCGRCIWACPNGAFYTPSLSLPECAEHANFTYEAGLFASHFHLAPSSAIDHLVAYPVQGGRRRIFTADAYVVACGALSSSNLLLRSIYKCTGETFRLTGLTDNRQVLAPFINLGMFGRSYTPDSYQYHQLAIGLCNGQYVHGQITTLKAALVHPIIQSLPLDLRSGAMVLSNLRSGLGVLSLFFSDSRRDDSYLTLEHATFPATRHGWPLLSIHYTPPDNEGYLIRGTLRKVRRFFRSLGAPLLPAMTQIRPMGSGLHYSGTMPMSRASQPWSLTANCQSRDIPNMFVIDGAAMPFLPAKNLTFTLMANAARVAETAF